MTGCLGLILAVWLLLADRSAGSHSANIASADAHDSDTITRAPPVELAEPPDDEAGQDEFEVIPVARPQGRPSRARVFVPEEPDDDAFDEEPILASDDGPHDRSFEDDFRTPTADHSDRTDRNSATGSRGRADRDEILSDTEEEPAVEVNTGPDLAMNGPAASRHPADVEDDGARESADDADQPREGPSHSENAPLLTGPAPSLVEESEEPVAATEDEPRDEAGIAGASPFEWRNLRETEITEINDQPASEAGQSSAVETVVYSNTDEPRPAVRQPSGERAVGANDKALPQPAAPAGTRAKPGAGGADLRLEIRGPHAARVGDTVEYEFRVSNAGREDAHGVRLSVELPASLQHPEGATLEQTVAQIRRGGIHRGLLRLRVVAAGTAAPRVEVEKNGHLVTRCTACLAVFPRAVAERGDHRATRPSESR